MNLLRKFFFPGVNYPGAFFYHIILGGLVAALIGVVTFGYNGHGHLWLPITGAVLAIIAGYIVAVITDPKQ